MIEKHTYYFTSAGGIRLAADWYPAGAKRRGVTIVYLHGGGLLYGVRDDLPRPYLQMLLAAGYDVLAPDYPLAPESALPEILTVLQEQLEYYLQRDSRIGEEKINNDYVLFGRSAGAYLAFMLAGRMAVAPRALICLYGYTGLDVPEFAKPSAYYSKLAAVSIGQAEKLIGAAPVTYAPLESRLSLYIHARQTGRWPEYLGAQSEPQRFALTEAELKQLPPLFLAAATEDPDVPYRCSKALSRILPRAQMLTVYGSEHDFDRNTNDPDSIKVYAAILKFLEQIFILEV